MLLKGLMGGMAASTTACRDAEVAAATIPSIYWIRGSISDSIFCINASSASKIAPNLPMWASPYTPELDADCWGY